MTNIFLFWLSLIFTWVPKSDFQNNFSMSKISQISLKKISLKNNRLGMQLLLRSIFDWNNSWSTLFSKMTFNFLMVHVKVSKSQIKEILIFYWFFCQNLLSINSRPGNSTTWVTLLCNMHRTLNSCSDKLGKNR